MGLGPLALSSMGRCGHVELGGLEFDGARMAGVCVDRGNRSGWRLGADLRPQTCSYPWQLLPGDWPGEMSLRARVGRAAGLWLSPCCPPAPFLFCIEAAPGMRRVPLPNLSSLCLSSVECPARRPFLRQVSLLSLRLLAQLLWASGEGERINRALGRPLPHHACLGGVGSA